MNKYNFTFPVESWKRISSFFGYRDITGLPEGATAFHDAIDISAKAGTNVLAAYDGIIKNTIRGNKYRGNYIVIEHDNGVSTEYSHLQDILVNVGETVKAGSVIGLVGSTGASTGPHLDFKIKKDGKAVDPLTFEGITTNDTVTNITELANTTIDKIIPVIKNNWIIVALGMILFAVFSK